MFLVISSLFTILNMASSRHRASSYFFIIYDSNDESFTSQSDNEVAQESDDSGELTEADLDFMETNDDNDDIDADSLDIDISDEDAFDQDSIPVVPVYTPEEDEGEEISGDEIGYNKGDTVSHPRYGQGVIEKIIKYGNKTLCSIAFENVGRRLLDPSISEFEKI